MFKIEVGDCLEALRRMPDASVDAVVTDPPYGLGREPNPREVLRAWLDGAEFKPGGTGFMGKAWDAFVPSPLVWAECWRVLKPGGHLLAFAGSRTYDWIVLGVRLAGFEVRDQLLWLYGSGFPKSLNVSKAIDRAAGAEREVVGETRASIQRRGPTGAFGSYPEETKRVAVTAPATEAARQWDGWGTALKPAHEPIVMARKPLDGTVAANVTRHGTGAINVDGCRIGTNDTLGRASAGWLSGGYVGGDSPKWDSRGVTVEGGRWPANIMHDGSAEVLAGFPVTGPARAAQRGTRTGSVTNFGGSDGVRGHDDAGGTAARFYYCGKASRAERERGLTHTKGERRNIHPTVKPAAIMRWLIRLVTPPAGTVLDPYAGSGTTGVACALEGFKFIGCELSPEYAAIARARIEHARTYPSQWEPDADTPDEPNEDQLDMFK